MAILMLWLDIWLDTWSKRSLQSNVLVKCHMCFSCPKPFIKMVIPLGQCGHFSQVGILKNLHFLIVYVYCQKNFLSPSQRRYIMNLWTWTWTCEHEPVISFNIFWWHGWNMPKILFPTLDKIFVDVVKYFIMCIWMDEQ